MTMGTVFVTNGEREFRVAVHQDGRIELDGMPVDAAMEELGPGTFSILVGGRSHRLAVSENGDGFEMLMDGVVVRMSVATERERLLKQYATTAAAGKHRFEVRAPMPAMVTRIEVKAGDDVTEGQGLIILEAMKMENEIRSHQAGRVKEVCVSQGKAVEKGELLLLLE